METVSTFIPESRTTQAILIGAAVGLVVYIITKKRYRYPPGPWGPPFIGNLLSLRKDTLYRKLIEWEKDYGPVITVHMGPIRVVCLNRLDVIQEAFVKKSVDFAGRPRTYSIEMFTEGYKDIALTDYGPTWQLHRRLALKALGHYMKGNKFEETISEVLGMVFAEMRKEKGAFNIQRHIELIVFNILSKICFDEMLTKVVPRMSLGNGQPKTRFQSDLYAMTVVNQLFALDDEEFLRFCKVMDEANKELGNGVWEDVIPPLRLCPTQKFRKMEEFAKVMLDFHYKRINHHRATFSPDIQRDFTDAMLLAQTDAEAEENPELLAQITDTHVAQTVSDIFQAGIDTSKQTLYWTVLFVSAHPEIQAKIHEEIDSVLGARTTPRLSDRAKLPYTEAVLYESMRVATVAPLSLPHATTCDTTIGGYEIPKGTMVMANLYAVHHNPKHWPDPDKFKPERFLDTSGTVAHRPEGWMPFSSGKRACMAESLAKPELHLLLAGLYRNFEIHLPEGVTADLNPLDDNGLSYITKTYDVVIKDRFE